MRVTDINIFTDKLYRVLLLSGVIRYIYYT